MKSVNDPEFKLLEEDYDFNYQKKLTEQLDLLSTEFDQNIINQIVLWKVNRYVDVPSELLDKLNLIKKDDTVLDEQLTISILTLMLQTRGIQLPMASTILRFKNRHIYQIIDQRVFRILYSKSLNVTYSNTENSINKSINLYFTYLNDLKRISKKYNIRFEEIDRVLYKADKRLNKKEKLLNY